MSKLNTNFYDAVSLDHIIDTAITDTFKICPEFINRNEGAIMAELLSYTKTIMRIGKANTNDTETAFIMEKHAASLLDAIFDISHEYIKHGMRAGAHLLLELLVHD